MQTTFVIVALAAFTCSAFAVESVTTYNGQFEITVVSAPLPKRDSTCGQEGYLTLTLADGILKDAKGRTGYIASNFQFQFDAPPQLNALSSSGWSIYNNGSLALANNAIFYQCLSGSFYNLYSSNWAPQCSEILINIMPCGGSTGIGQLSDGQPTATSAGPLPVTQITDGQIQAATGVPVSEFTDGQPQVVTTAAPVSTSSGLPVTQISDGQPQAPTSTVVATTALPVTQISDGQPQAPTSTALPVTQISDGQPQVPTSTIVATTALPVTQISDGQPQAPTSTVASSSSVSTLRTTATSTSSASASTSPTPLQVNGASGLTVASSFAALVFGVAAAFHL